MLRSGGGRGGRQRKWSPPHSPSQQAPGSASPLSVVGSATSDLASIAQDASWLTMATVPHCVLPVLGAKV